MLTETTIRGETFTYRMLWDCCLAQIKAAEKSDEGERVFNITSMLMAYFTYESYINFLWDRFATEKWAKELKSFSQNQKSYRGLLGKLKYLSERIPLEGMEKIRKQMQTISRLKKLRDFLSHGPVDRYEKSIVHHRDKEPPLLGYGKIDRYVTPNLAARAINDVREVIEFLHVQARKRSEDMWLKRDPFDQFRAHADSDSKTMA